MKVSGESLLPEWRSLPALGPSEVRVFTLRTDSDPALLSRAEGLLSAAELERAQRIRVTPARSEFVVGRAALRVLAGAATEVHPRALRVEADAFGKPVVPGVHSNVSHSRGLVYVALCRKQEVGVDVEWIDLDLDILEIAEANFTPEETARLSAEKPGWKRAHAFYRIWTRKEAVAKAYGQGLRVPLGRIVVAEGATRSAWIVRENAAAENTEPGRLEFFVDELAAPQGFAAALALRGVEGPVDRIIIW